MRIDPQIPAAGAAGADWLNELYSGGVSTNTAAASSSQPKDTVQLSDTQATLSNLVSQLSNVPDIRQAKVDALRSQIQSGQYQIDNHRVASAIVDELVGPNGNG